MRVTYQDACHLAHSQRIRRQPRDLIKRLPGIDFVEMEHPDICCGSAGIYNALEPPMSRAILDQKMEDALGTRAELLVTANPGCHMQLESGARAHGSQMRVEHLAQLLLRAYE